MGSDSAGYVTFGNVKISDVNYRKVLALVKDAIDRSDRGYICLNDVSNIIVATRDDQMRAAINDSLLSLADGTPVAWYGRMAGCRGIERISGVALMEGLLRDLPGCRHFLLGDTEQTIGRVIARARELNPAIRISGYSPPFREFTEEDNRLILETIGKVNPDLIWVSFGGGRQEKWMREHVGRIDHGVLVGAGAAFKWLIGDIVRPPVIFQKMGMQWLFRLAQGFLQDPVLCVKNARRRGILRNKLVFVLNLPGELRKARHQVKLRTME